MPEVSSVPMDVIKVEGSRGEPISAKTPLGLEGMEKRADELVAAGNRDKSEALVQKVSFMRDYCQHLVGKSIYFEEPLTQEKGRLERQLKVQASKMGGSAFLMDISDSDASLVSKPQREKGVPDADNIAQLALAHSVVAGVIAQGKEGLADLQTGRLTAGYAELRQRLETYVAGGKYAKPAVESNIPAEPVKPAMVPAEGRKVVEAAAGGSRIDESLGPLGSQKERDLVKDIQAALADGTGFGFLLNSKEAGGKDNLLNRGWGNRDQVNVTERESDVIGTLVDRVPYSDGTLNANPTRDNYASVRLIAPQNLRSETLHSQESREILKTFRPRLNGKMLIGITYPVTIREKDPRGTDADYKMYVALPTEVANEVFSYFESHKDDSTLAVRVLGHALGEDLDNNWQNDQGVDQHSKLNVEGVRLTKS